MVNIQIKRKSKVNKKKIILIIAASFIVLLLAAGMIVTIVMMRQNFSRGDYPDHRFTVDYCYEHYKTDYPRDEVSFKSGENTLKGFIYGADNTKGLVVFAHGIGSGHEDYTKELLWFVDNGWRVFSYDATGSGYSEGNGTRGLPQSALDLDAALTFVENDSRFNDLPVFLMGHSWGGYAVTAVLNFDHNITASASISGYNKPVDMIMEWTENMMGAARYIMFPFIWTYNKALFGSNSGLTAVDGINKSNIPVMIIHGTEDKTIGFDKSSIISQKDKITNPNVSYLPLENAGHNNLFYTKEALDYIKKFNDEYKSILDSYNGKIPEEELVKIYDRANKNLINTPNEELLTYIENFFEENL